VIEGVHVVPMGKANAYLIEGDDGLTLIDAGFPGKEAAVFDTRVRRPAMRIKALRQEARR
jgi:glyoxylase-like metal-dependent hydrolase (beta-lactamase superfamily II)